MKKLFSSSYFLTMVVLTAWFLGLIIAGSIGATQGKNAIAWWAIAFPMALVMGAFPLAEVVRLWREPQTEVKEVKEAAPLAAQEWSTFKWITDNYDDLIARWDNLLGQEFIDWCAEERTRFLEWEEEGIERGELTGEDGSPVLNDDQLYRLWRWSEEVWHEGITTGANL